MRPASKAQIQLEASVLAALEADILPETILEIVGEALEEADRNGLIDYRRPNDEMAHAEALAEDHVRSRLVSLPVSSQPPASTEGTK